MIGLDRGMAITAMLGTPGSPEYLAAKAILNERPLTLWDALDAAGITDIPQPGKAELYWVCATMPDDLQARILQRVRVALNVGIPVIVRWEQGPFGVGSDVADHADGMHMVVTSPIPDLTKLKSGYAGALHMAGAL